MIISTYDTPSGRKVIMESSHNINGATKVVRFIGSDGLHIKSSYVVDDSGCIDLNVLESAKILLRQLGLHGLAEDIETTKVKVDTLMAALLEDTDWRNHYAIRADAHGLYHVYCQGEDTFFGGRHNVYYRPEVKLTNRGYPTRAMAERVCEMRSKLKLDEPESEARTYLRSHFTDALEVLEQ